MDRALRALIWGLGRLPYDTRVRACGWITGKFLGSVLGFNRRARANLSYVFPEWSAAKKRRVATEASNNVGRTLIEIYSGQEFVDRQTSDTLSGPGVALMQEAQDNGRAVILATGHFGNYEATRAAMLSLGRNVAAFYRPTNNRFFNDHYVKTIEGYGQPLFPRGPVGFRGVLQHLKNGGLYGMLHDQYMRGGANLTFMGKPTKTALSIAELALKYDALLLPCYGIRNPDGLSFNVVVEAAVPASDAETMVQALNDSLEARILENPGQWFWQHRRWKRQFAE